VGSFQPTEEFLDDPVCAEAFTVIEGLLKRHRFSLWRRTVRTRVAMLAAGSASDVERRHLAGQKAKP
jgi:hypothetical protein